MNAILIISLIFFFFLSFLRPKFAIYLISAGLSLYLIRFSIFSIPTTLVELLIYLLVLSILFKEILLKRNSFSLFKTSFELPIFLLLIAGLISVIISPEKRTSLGILKAYFIDPILLFYAISFLNKFPNSYKFKRNLIFALGIGAVIISIIGLVQFFFFPSYLQDGRIKSVFLSPNYLGLYLGPIWMLLFSSLIVWKGLLSKICFGIFLVPLSLAVYFSYSRGTWLGILGALVIFLCFLLRKEFKLSKKLVFLIGGGLGILILLFIIKGLYFLGLIPSFRTIAADELRIEIWKTSLLLLKDHFIFGLGLGSFKKIFTEFTSTWINYPEFISPHAITPHNLILNFWLQTGILGLIAFLWILIKFFKKGKISFLAPVLIPTMSVILIHGLVDTPYWKNDLSCLFWILLSLSLEFKKDETENKKRIGIDCRMLSWGGIGRYTKNLIKNLAKLDQEREYILFLFKEDFNKLKNLPKNFKKREINIYPYSWAEQIIFPLILYKENLDLVHFTHFSLPIFYRRKFIVTIHDLTHLKYPGKKLTFFKKIAYNLVLLNATKKAEKIIAVSFATRSDLIKLLKIDPNKITVIYEGVEEHFKPLKIEKKPFLLYVGVFREHKNLKRLIKAFKIVTEKIPDLKLVIAGKKDKVYFPEIEKEVENLNLRRNVIFLGFVRESKLPYLYNRATLFVFPSLYEGFGLPPLEAMACGTPVICSNTSSLPEICEDAALFFDPLNEKELAKKILMLISDEKFRQELIKKGFKRVEKFSWRKCAKETLNLYQKCLKR